MEPPSPKSEQIVKTDSKSDDPLSNCIFFILTNDSLEEGSETFICAHSADTDTSYYIGCLGKFIS